MSNEVSDLKRREADIAVRSFRPTQRNFPIVTQFQLLQFELAKQGLGLMILPEDIGDNEPLLERAFPKLDPIVMLELWLVCHRELKTNRRVRLVFDMLAKELKN